MNLALVATSVTAMETNLLSMKEQLAKAQFVFDTRITSDSFYSEDMVTSYQVGDIRGNLDT